MRLFPPGKVSRVLLRILQLCTEATSGGRGSARHRFLRQAPMERQSALPGTSLMQGEFAADLITCLFHESKLGSKSSVRPIVSCPRMFKSKGTCSALVIQKACCTDPTAAGYHLEWLTCRLFRYCRLVMQDGSVWHGKGFGYQEGGTQVGEVVFNTTLTGYQELLTDPSYRGQFVCYTVPHVGNVGINAGTIPESVPCCHAESARTKQLFLVTGSASHVVVCRGHRIRKGASERHHCEGPVLCGLQLSVKVLARRVSEGTEGPRHCRCRHQSHHEAAARDWGHERHHHHGRLPQVCRRFTCTFNPSCVLDKDAAASNPDHWISPFVCDVIIGG